MKKIMALLLCVSMALAYASAAFAEEPLIKTTREFLRSLDEKEVAYTYKGLSPAGNSEIVAVVFDSDVIGPVCLNLFFYDDCQTCSIILWNLIDYASSDTEAVAQSCYQLTCDYRFAKFYTEISDNSVTVEQDLLLDKDLNCSSIVANGMVTLTSIAERAYTEAFSQYVNADSDSKSRPSLLSLISQE